MNIFCQRVKRRVDDSLVFISFKDDYLEIKFNNRNWVHNKIIQNQKNNRLNSECNISSID